MLELIKKNLHILIAFYIFVSLLIGASYVLKGSIRFDADISRDFLLLDELSTKKFIVIGPRASGMPGVFHGPLWIYLNYPAYFLGNANPVAVGSWWVLLVSAFLLSSYLLVTKITNKKTALIFIMLLAGMLIPWIHQLLNPFGALALMPLLLYLTIKYQESKKVLFWVATIFTLGMMIQFQMAVGVPITILVVVWLAYWMFHNKKLKHLLLLPLFLIPLASFLIFDVRHDFLQTRSAINFVTNKTDVPEISIYSRIDQRINLLSKQGFHVLNMSGLGSLNLVFFMMVVVQISTNHFKLNQSDKKLFNFVFYLYIGYYVISLLFNGDLLIYYWWPLVPLPYLLIALLFTYSKNRAIKGLLLLVLLANLLNGVKFLNYSNSLINNHEDDWLFQKNMVTKLFEGEEQEFGYFIFTPDVYAYESKAAMTYAIKKHPTKNVIRYKKEPVTYLILAPADIIRPDVNSDVWKDQRLNLSPTEIPETTIEYKAGYRIEKFFFSEEQIKVEPNPTIDDWLYFR